MIDRIDDIDLLDPVERDHPLLRDCVWWWLSLPNTWGGTQVFDIMNSYHATRVNDPTWRADGGINFNGSTQSLSPTFNVNPTLPYTMCLTHRVGAVGSTQGVFLKSAGAGTIWHGLFFRSTNRWRFGVSGTTSESTTAGAVGNTRRIVGTYNGTTHSLYIDGVLQYSEARSAADQSTWTIGRRIDGFFTNGSLRDMRIHNRQLSEQEVIDDYKQQREGYPDLLRRLTRKVYSIPAPPPAITRRPFFSDWGSMC